MKNKCPINKGQHAHKWSEKLKIKATLGHHVFMHLTRKEIKEDSYCLVLGRVEGHFPTLVGMWIHTSS